MSQHSCDNCGKPLTGRQRKYCTKCRRLASLLWNRKSRRNWKALDPDYWRDVWKNKTTAERRRYLREYMRQYRRGIRRRRLIPSTALSMVLVTGLCVIGCAHPSTSSTENALLLLSQAPGGHVTPPPETPPLKLRLADRRILVATGWLTFVETNIDFLNYYHWPGFATELGPASGVATFTDGLRIADVATRGRTDRDVAATIVHEAAHLAGISQQGQMHSQNHANAIEAKFLAAYDEFQKEQEARNVTARTSQPSNRIVIRCKCTPSSTAESRKGDQQ